MAKNLKYVDDITIAVKNDELIEQGLKQVTNSSDEALEITLRSSSEQVLKNSNIQKNGKLMTWNEFQSANKGKYTKAEMSEAWKAYKIKNGVMEVAAKTSKVNVNSLDYEGINYGYALVDKDTRMILKFGETTNPSVRYSKQYFKEHNAEMVIMETGSKRYIHQWQHGMNNYYYKRYGEYPKLVKSKNGW